MGLLVVLDGVELLRHASMLSMGSYEARKDPAAFPTEANPASCRRADSTNPTDPIGRVVDVDYLVVGIAGDGHEVVPPAGRSNGAK